jgi:probable addiction module antidote protein
MTKKLKTKKWDSAAYLKDDKEIVAYLNACLEEHGDDPAFIAKAFGVVARAQGMSAVAKKAGLTREGLYKSLSAAGKPEFATILKVTHALGMRLHIA